MCLEQCKPHFLHFRKLLKKSDYLAFWQSKCFVYGHFFLYFSKKCEPSLLADTKDSVGFFFYNQNFHLTISLDSNLLSKSIKISELPLFHAADEINKGQLINNILKIRTLSFK